MAQSIRVSDEVYELAQAASASLGRSLAQQIEYWVRLGARADMGLTAAEVLDLLGGEGASSKLEKRLTDDAALREEIAARHARVEAEVAAKQRDAASLIVFSKKFVQSAKLTFPVDAFSDEAW
ncbi:MAG TPA: hypothetical protein VGM81_18780 [Burkholderiaceae bacterium]|jgi:hypothetical protein